MKIISNIATLSMSFGLAVFAGTFLFGAGSLTVLGFVCMVPLFVGASAHVALGIVDFIPEKADKPAGDEINNLKEKTA